MLLSISWPHLILTRTEILVKNAWSYSTCITIRFDVWNAKKKLRQKKKLENFRFKVMISNCSISLSFTECTKCSSYIRRNKIGLLSKGRHTKNSQMFESHAKQNWIQSDKRKEKNHHIFCRKCWIRRRTRHFMIILIMST